MFWIHSKPQIKTDVSHILFIYFNYPSNGSHLKDVLFFCTSANPGPQCDLTGGWRQYGSDCYKLKSDTKKSWSAARYDCVQEGGDLVSITTAEEEQYVMGTQDGAPQFDLWIGLSTLVRILFGHVWLYIDIEVINAKIRSVSSEMQQDFMWSWSREQPVYLVWCSPSGIHELGQWSTYNVRCDIIYLSFNYRY